MRRPWDVASAGLLPLLALQHVTVSAALVIQHGEAESVRVWADTVVKNRKELCAGLYSIVAQATPQRMLVSLEVVLRLLLDALAQCGGGRGAQR